MTTPLNLGLAIGAPESKLLSAFFAMQAMKGTYRDVKSAAEAYEHGNNAEAVRFCHAGWLKGRCNGWSIAGAHAYKGLPEGLRTEIGK